MTDGAVSAVASRVTRRSCRADLQLRAYSTLYIHTEYRILYTSVLLRIGRPRTNTRHPPRPRRGPRGPGRVTERTACTVHDVAWPVARGGRVLPRRASRPRSRAAPAAGPTVDHGHLTPPLRSRLTSRSVVVPRARPVVTVRIASIGRRRAASRQASTRRATARADDHHWPFASRRIRATIVARPTPGAGAGAPLPTRRRRAAPAAAARAEQAAPSLAVATVEALATAIDGIGRRRRQRRAALGRSWCGRRCGPCQVDPKRPASDAESVQEVDGILRRRHGGEISKRGATWPAKRIAEEAHRARERPALYQQLGEQRVGDRIGRQVADEDRGVLGRRRRPLWRRLRDARGGGLADEEGRV